MRLLRVILVIASAITLSIATSCNIGESYDNANTKYIVDCHNSFRSHLALGNYVAANNTEKVGSATNMRKMEWNCSIQEKAQHYANLFANNCSLIHSKFNGWGENLAGWNAPLSLKPVVNGSGLASCMQWSNEFVTHGTNELKYSYGVGHATAMAWWETNQIGCGYIVCPNMADNKNRRLTVCNYWPPGNWAGQPAFTVGPTCSDCGKGYKCDPATPKTGLCVKE